MILRLPMKCQLQRSEDDLSTETFAQGGPGLTLAIRCVTGDVDGRSNKQVKASEVLFYQTSVPSNSFFPFKSPSVFPYYADFTNVFNNNVRV